jgi:hypothetical protein
MKGLGRKASFLALIAVMATALVGSAYTLWHEDLSSTQNISTASLDARITCAPPTDNENPLWPTPGFGSFFAAYPVAAINKDVASVTLSPQAAPYHEIEVLVSNAYPGYAFDCEVHISNPTNLPWHVEDERFQVLQCDQSGNNCVPLQPPPASWTTTCTTFSCAWGDRGINPPTYPAGLSTWSPIFAQATNWKGCQVHLEDDFIGGSIFVGINQSAHQNTAYKIVFQYQVNQWNESSWTGCGVMKPGVTDPTLSQLK